MNILSLELIPSPYGLWDWRVAIRIDGESLICRVLRVEADYLRSIDAEITESRYSWVRARLYLLPYRAWLGAPELPWFPGFSEVVVCSCGEAMCRAISVKIEVWPNRIAWMAWRQFPTAQSSVSNEFRPLLFDRQQYESELTRVSEEYQRHVNDGE